MSEPAAPKVSLRTFWAELPVEGRWLLSTTTVQTIGRGMALPFTIVYLTEVRHIGLDVAGTLMGLIAVVALVVTGPAGALTDRLGSRVVVMASSVAGMIAPLVMGFGTGVPAFATAVAFMGFSWGISWAAWNALIASVVAGPARQRFFGINFALINLGIGIGGVLSGLFVDVQRPWTFTAIFVVDALCMLVPITLLLGPLRHVGHSVSASTDGDAPVASYRALLRTPAVLWLAGLTMLTTLVGYGQMESGFPAFSRQFAHVSTRTLGLAFAANTLVIVALQFAVLQRIDGRRRTRILMAMSAIWALSWLVLGSTAAVAGTTTAAAGVIAFTAIFGFGETMMQATIPALVNDLADDHTRGRANSVNSGAFQLGAILGPVLAGTILHAGRWTLFIAVMVLGCAVVAASARGIERLLSPAVNGQHAQEGAQMPQVPDHS